MNKDLFYNNLHKEIAEQYNTRPDFIEYIRVVSKKKGFRIHDFITYLTENINRPIAKKKSMRRKKELRTHNRKFYEDILSFTLSITPDDFEVINTYLPSDTATGIPL